MEMTEAYDFKALTDSLKSKGMDVAEDAVMLMIDDLFDWLTKSAELSETPYDNVLLAVYPTARLEIKKAADKMDGKVG